MVSTMADRETSTSGRRLAAPPQLRPHDPCQLMEVRQRLLEERALPAQPDPDLRSSVRLEAKQ